MLSGGAASRPCARAALPGAPVGSARSECRAEQSVRHTPRTWQAVVHRYGPNGTLWAHHPQLRPYAVTTFDLWNEPYYDLGSDGRYDPARYARLVRAAATAGHAADGSARFLLAAEMQGTMITGHRWLWWVDAMYRAVPDLNRYFDGISVHPYGHDITHRSPGDRGSGLLRLRPDAPGRDHPQRVRPPRRGRTSRSGQPRSGGRRAGAGAAGASAPAARSPASARCCTTRARSGQATCVPCSSTTTTISGDRAAIRRTTTG